NNSAPGYRPRKGSSRIANFVAHNRGEFQSNQSETNYAEGIQHKPRVSGNAKICGGNGCSQVRPNCDSQADQYSGSDERSNRTKVVQPLAYAQPHDVYDREKDEKTD